jgi:EKC/KEOPS complex subunit CGI121/TPRKB
MQSYELPQFPAHMSCVHAALYTDVSDSELLRKRLITASVAEGSDGERERDALNFSFIEARLVWMFPAPVGQRILTHRNRSRA